MLMKFIFNRQAFEKQLKLFPEYPDSVEDVGHAYIIGKKVKKHVDKSNCDIKTWSDGIKFFDDYKKLLALSDGTTLGEELFGLYDKISKKQGSKNFKQLLNYRDNLINYYVNQVDLDGLKTIVIEDLVNVKHGSKSRINNKLQRWSYRKTIDKINRTCEVNGIELVKVSPAYTSQTCSKCDNVDKESRNG